MIRETDFTNFAYAALLVEGVLFFRVDFVIYFFLLLLSRMVAVVVVVVVMV